MLIGYAGLNRADVEGEPVVEAGWSVTPERCGEGLATEAARASVSWAFDRLGMARIVSFTLSDNHASRRVMEKLGMTYVREFERRGLRHVLYRLSA
jgi:RimJ/RimL family protein N-acetyltransferase